MADASTYVQDWINYWGRLGATLSKRVQAASRDARAGTYGLDRIVSDTIAAWADGYDALSGALLGRGGGREPAVVFFRITPNTESKRNTVRVAVPGDALPTVTALARIGGGGEIPSGLVAVEVGSARDALTVKLVNLTKAGTLLAGHYAGFVYADENPIALVLAVVTS